MSEIKTNPASSPLLRLIGAFRKRWGWVVLIVFALVIRLFAMNAEQVEVYYSQGIYPFISSLLRGALNWLPLSVGDLLYGLVALYGIGKAISMIKRVIAGSHTPTYWLAGLRNICFAVIVVYVVFNLCWGLNYNRLGIGHQLKLQPSLVSQTEIDTLTVHLLKQANRYSGLVGRTTRQQFKQKEKLFNRAESEVQQASLRYPFLEAKLGAVKPSIYSYLGNYLGFQGYYNPFTGEGQVNTTIPVFLRPFVATHEIAHQLGYAKESEANFVGFLVCKDAQEPLFRYAAYLDMYLYAHSILYQVDSARANQIRMERNKQVQADIQELKSFYQQYQTPLEELVMQGYDFFLQANEQPQGKQSYSQVLRWLMAWVRKEGWEAL